MAEFPCKYGYDDIIRFKLTKKATDVTEGRVVGVFMSATFDGGHEPIYVCHSLDDAEKHFFFKEIKESNIIDN